MVVAVVLTRRVECFNAPQAMMELFVALEGLMVVVEYLLETGSSAPPALSARKAAAAVSSQTMDC